MYERILTFCVGLLLGVIGTFGAIKAKAPAIPPAPAAQIAPVAGQGAREVIRQANETQDRYLDQIHEIESDRDSLKTQVSELQDQVRKDADNEAFNASAYTLIYEPGDPTPEEAPGDQLLDTLKPGLGKLIAGLQRAANAQEGITDRQGYGHLRWVLYRKPSGFPQGLLMPKGGHVVTTFTLPSADIEAH